MNTLIFDIEAMGENFKVEINNEFKRALELLEGGYNVFVGGKAGTGKSTLLEYFRANTNKKVVVLAPTGVAALNVAGKTIHSFFRFPPGITVEEVKRKRPKQELKKLIKNVDAIIIDEISMVRADLLDCVDAALRLSLGQKLEPFGGMQMIFIGDLYQLDPIVQREEEEFFKTLYQSPYFFDADVFSQQEFFRIPMKYIELRKIYRQKDSQFTSILNRIRENRVSDFDLELLNRRCLENSEFPRRDRFCIILTPTNNVADIINLNRLNEIKSKTFSYEGLIEGKFSENYLPTLRIIQVKVGAQIMLLNNDPNGRWVNGSVGIVKDIKPQEKGADTIFVEFPDGKTEKIYPHTWEIFKYVFDPEKKVLATEIIGSFKQYPFRLAWAVTIHKGQGKTFDDVIIDLGRGAFAHGQTYVALSRCTTLDGIRLKRPVARDDILLDPRVPEFISRISGEK